MDLQDVQKHWNEFGKIDPLWAILTWPDRKENKWQREEFFKTGAIEVDIVMQYVESLGITYSRGKALDFGCGVGRLTQALACYFDEVYGVDIAPSMIELARQYNQHDNKCRYYLNETDNLKLFDDNSFDFIFTIFTLQHMEPKYIKNYIKEFLRCLTPYGILIFQLPVPLNQNSARQVRRLRNFIKPIIPKLTLDLYHELYRLMKTRHCAQPTMEMYGINREEMIEFLGANRAKILDIQDQAEEFIRLIKEHKINPKDIISGEFRHDLAAYRGINFRYCVSKA